MLTLLCNQRWPLSWETGTVFSKLLVWLQVSSGEPHVLWLVVDTNPATVKIPKPKEQMDLQESAGENIEESELPLPQTLVRIPTEHAPMLQPNSVSSPKNED